MNFNKLAELHKTQDKRFEGTEPTGTVSKGRFLICANLMQIDCL